MEKMEMLRHYENLNFAKNYILGFIYKHRVYMVQTAELNPDLITVEVASRNQGLNLRLRIRKAYKEMLLAESIYLCDDIMLDDVKYNKGEIFEKMVTEYFGQSWKKDNIPFTMAGDIEIDGIAIQIKLDSATLVNTKQLEKLMAR